MRSTTRMRSVSGSFFSASMRLTQPSFPKSLCTLEILSRKRLPPTYARVTASTAARGVCTAPVTSIVFSAKRASDCVCRQIQPAPASTAATASTRLPARIMR